MNDIISPELIYKINNLYHFIEINSDDIDSQFKILQDFQNGIISYKTEGNNVNNAKHFVNKILNKKYLALNKNLITCKWPLNSRTICSAELGESIKLILNYLIDYLKKLWVENTPTFAKPIPIKDSLVHPKVTFAQAVQHNAEHIIAPQKNITNDNKNSTSVNKPDETLIINVCLKCKLSQIVNNIRIENNDIALCNACIVSFISSNPISPAKSDANSSKKSPVKSINTRQNNRLITTTTANKSKSAK